MQAKLVKQEQQNIDGQFEKKKKSAEVAQKMYVVRFLVNGQARLFDTILLPPLSDVPRAVHSQRRTTSRG